MNRTPLIRLSLLSLLIALTFNAGASMHLDRMLATRAIDPATSSLMVMDLETGEILDTHNAGKPLIPASIMKTATIAALLPKTGCSYRYETDLAIEGKVRNGTLEGNLVVIGSGDPSINAGCDPAGPDFLAFVVDALKKEGITRIEGEILVDESVFTSPAIPPTWAAADTRQKYGTGCHGFNFRHNASGSSAVADPATVFRKALQPKLSAAGISLLNTRNADKGKKRKTIATYRSASIDEIMRSCMMRSDNLFAEALLRTIPVADGKPGDTERGAAIEMEYWNRKGIPTEGVTIIDGSGLSRSNRATADFFANILKVMSEDPDYASFLPLAGQEGTLKSFLKDTPLDSYIALKTGSMNGIQCYAGYKLDDDFVPTHVVVLMLNSLPKGRAAARSAFERYLLDIFSDKPSAGL